MSSTERFQIIVYVFRLYRFCSVPPFSSVLFPAVFSTNTLKITSAAAPAQHQMADKVSDWLVNTVGHLTAKRQVFPSEVGRDQTTKRE